MDFNEIKKLDEKYILQTYNRYPLALVRGKGCNVWDTDGKEYLDLIAGIACLPLGHSHPRLVKAVKEQAEKLVHVSNLFYNENQVQLAKMLSDLAPMKTKIFFGNSGAEANEAAIKVSRKFTGRREIIAMSHSFHGRTMGSLAITDKKKYQKPFEPLMPETNIVEYGNIESLEKAMTDNTAAVFVELIQGEAGVKFARGNLKESIKYFKEVRKLCDEKGVLMVVDEVQTGAGRTGTFFASEQFGIKPDVLTTAKGIASGLPMGAALISEKVASCMEKGDHASTFGGGPLTCAAGIATIETILDEKLMDNAKRMGDYLLKQLGPEARGLGLIIGLQSESKEKAEGVMDDMRDKGILINVTSDSVIRFVPPLIITKKEIDFAVENLRESMKKF